VQKNISKVEVESAILSIIDQIADRKYNDGRSRTRNWEDKVGTK
jgi:hypothetical protein